jgi:N-dimethylarginine dimethylaminohydrolase
MSAIINRTVLMSGADYFDDSQAINPYYIDGAPVNIAKAQAEHTMIRHALESAGITVVKVPPPKGCQDGIYTANWALIRGNTAILSHLPNAREAEEPYAEKVLKSLGKKVYKVPDGMHFSGQGDHLACGNYLFTGSGYRTDPRTQDFVAKALGYEIISLQTVPELNRFGKPVINTASGWPDSFFYDIDLALAVIRPDLIAWCPAAFMPESQQKLRAFTGVKKIEVSLSEAEQAFACNLISTGEIVIMSDHAPNLKAAIESYGLRTITPSVTEIVRGGGYIRCTTLTLDNV